MHNYPLEQYKFYFDGNRVIAASTYAGRTVRGVAVCAEGDNYDIEKGKRLAAARCNQKIAYKRVKRALKRVADAEEARESAEVHYNKMDAYYEDALEAFDKATQAFEKLESEL